MISLIVPVFNKEKYIEACLESIKQQTYQNFECIIVDDGSIDKSASLIKKYLEDNRFIYLYKENGGVSSARNLGISKASRKWICFVDADDILEKNFLSNYMDIKIDDNVACVFNYKNDVEQEILNINFLIKNMNKYYDYKYYNPPWAKIFLKEKVKRRFNEDLSIGEDLIFNLNFLMDNLQNDILFINENGYVYSDNVIGSLSNSVTLKMIKNTIYLVSYIINLDQIETDKILQIQINSLVNKTIKMLIDDFDSLENLKILYDTESILKVKSKNRRLKILLFLMNHSLVLKLFIHLYKLKKEV